MPRIVFLAQLLVMLSAFAIFLVTPTDFHTLGIMFYLVILAAATTVFAVWQLIRNPKQRKWALATLVIPLVCLTTPFFIVSWNGGPVAPLEMFFVSVVFIGAGCFFMLSRKTLWQSEGSFVSKRFNIGLALALFVLLTLYWIPISAGLNMQDSPSLPSDIEERDRILRIALVYFAAVAGPALILSLFALLYAPIGLIKNSGARLVHVVQLLMALMTLTSLAIGAFVVGVAMVNPG